MDIEFYFTGAEDIERFKDLKIEINLPEHFYSNDMEYFIIDQVRYTISECNKCILDTENSYGNITGFSLYIQDKVGDKKIMYDNSTVYFYPYYVYRDVLNILLEDYSENLEKLGVYFGMNLNQQLNTEYYNNGIDWRYSIPDEEEIKTKRAKITEY